MHRSGTSLLTRGLNALGIELGDTLLKQSPAENPKGYWEDIDILRLSDRLLETMGRRWQSVKPLPPGEFSGDATASLVEEAAAMLADKIGSADRWGFKNPRTGPLIPFWETVFEKLDLEPRYLVAVRNPINVVRSLDARNHLAIPYGYALWTTNYLDTLINLSGKPAVFVSYERLLSEPGATLRRVANELDLHWSESVEANVRDFSDNFVSPELVHYAHDAATLQKDRHCFAQTKALYALLTRLSDRPDAPWDELAHRKIDEIARDWGQQRLLVEAMDEHEAKLDTRLAGYRKEIEAQHEDLAAKENVIVELREEEKAVSEAREAAVQETKKVELHLASAHAQIKTLTEEQERLREHRQTVEQHLETAHARVEGLVGEAETLRAETKRLEQHLDAAHARIDAQTGETEQLRAEKKQLEQHLGAAHEQISALGKKSDEIATENNVLRERLASLAAEADSKEAVLRERLEAADAVVLARQEEIAGQSEALSFRQDELRHLKNAVETLKVDRDKLEHIVERYDEAVSSLLSSSRWRIGNRIGELKRRLFRRPEVPLATHFLKELSVQFQDWRTRDKITDPGSDRPMQGDSARIFSGNRSAALSDRTTGIPGSAEDPRASVASYGLPLAPSVTIIVPIYNAADDVRNCVESLLRNTTMQASLCLIDDASPDPEIARLLSLYENIANIEVLTNPSNLGFTGTVNRGLQHTNGDVVVLNSDTVVGPRWLENLRFAAYSAPAVGTVTAISDNAGAFSAPVSGERNATPVALTDDEVARLVYQASARSYPDVPTGNGFCLYVKRAVIDRIGLLDIENFPRGYGEENDFCMRAMEAGFHHLIDDSTYVFHREGSSFQGARDALLAAGIEKINTLYPEYNRLVAAAFTSTTIERARQATGAAFDAASESLPAVRPRVLFLIHKAEGGMSRTALDLAAGLDRGYEAFILMSDGKNLDLMTREDGSLRKIGQVVLTDPIVDCRLPHPEYRSALSRILQDNRIELVHMHHAVSASLDICELLRAFDIPLVLSLHDFFFVCPTVNLLDQDDVYCAGECTEGAGACPVPFHHYAEIPGLKHGWVKAWRKQLGRLLNSADALVAPSQHVADVFRSAYPALSADKFAVIEHGRDLDSRNDCVAAPVAGEKVRILVPGVLARHKGAGVIRDLAMLDGGKRLEFHFLGRIPPQLEDIGTDHGTYEVDEFGERVRAIAPAFIGLFSITSETYGHVLTEAWSCGVPVLALDIGTQADRIGKHGGGWVLDARDSKAAYRKILEVADDADAYREQAELATLDGLPSITDMARQYDRAYRRIRYDRRPFKPLSEANRAARPFRIAVLPQTDNAGLPISAAFIRLTLPLTHPAARPTLDAAILSWSELETSSEPFDGVLVQRTAVPGDRADAFVQFCSRNDLPYMLDIDDDLLAIDAAHSEADHYGKEKIGLETLLRGAARTTVSTPVLATRYESLNGSVAMVPNALDEKLWFAPSDRITGRTRDYDGLGLFYMGTDTHSGDLRFLKEALEQLHGARGRPDIRLFVIGGEPAAAGQDWYTRIDVPLDNRCYPEFVAWLRSYRGYFDIALAPLTGTPFNEAKSHLKYLEYTALGLPGVYADLPAYNGTIRHRETGLLAGTTPEEWATAIGEIAKSEPLRADIAAAAREDVIANHLLSGPSKRFADLIEAMVTGSEPLP